MPANSELAVARKFIMSRLSGSVALTNIVTASRMFQHPAPREAVFPFITWRMVTAQDQYPMGQGGRRIITDFLFEIAIWTLDDDTGEKAHEALKIMDSLLEEYGYTVDVTLGTMLECRRQSPVDIPESDPNGPLMRRQGGLYKIVVKAS